MKMLKETKRRRTATITSLPGLNSGRASSDAKVATGLTWRRLAGAGRRCWRCARPSVSDAGWDDKRQETW